MSDEPITRISGTPPAGKAKAKPKGLGRGLGALMGETRREEPLARPNAAQTERSEPVTDGLVTLPICDIAPNPDQPRRHFDDGALGELAASIERRGVIQPVIVRPAQKGKYEIVAGERRWRAAQRAQQHVIPAIVRALSDRDVMAIALIENLQREDLNPIEEARAYHRLSEDEGMTQAAIAKMVDKSRSHVANFQRLLTLPDEVVALVERGELSMGHARALIGSDRAIELAREAIAGQMSVRELEKRVRSGDDSPGKSPKRRATKGSSEDADLAAMRRHLEEMLGLPVTIQTDDDPSSGSVTVRYETLDQLDLVCQRLTGGPI